MLRTRLPGRRQESSAWPVRATASRRQLASVTLPWRPAAVLDEWVTKEARPISLRQLTFFGRTLTESRLLSSANYVRTELPTRLAHRLRDMQTLPFAVVTNPHMSHVYDLYYKAFEKFRKVREIQTVEDNEKYCQLIAETLQEHLTVIPRLAMGVLECQNLMRAKQIDKLMNTLLRSRISRRVIAEQHLALTETFDSPWHFPHAMSPGDSNADFVGEVFLKCNASEVVHACWSRAKLLAKEAYGSECVLPQLKPEGHLGATFPYILSHLQYVIGELLRNSIQAVVEKTSPTSLELRPPIEVLICEAPQHVIIRVSDQGGGIPKEVMPELWSFSKSSRRQTHLENLSQVPKMAATMQELKLPESSPTVSSSSDNLTPRSFSDGSLSSLTSRPPNLRLGMGLPMSRVYAEYWAGSLEIHNLEGYGVDAFLQIPKLGNRNEQLSTRASIDAHPHTYIDLDSRRRSSSVLCDLKVSYVRVCLTSHIGMDTPKHEARASASRKALWDVSNGANTSNSGEAAPDPDKTPVSGVSRSQRAKTVVAPQTSQSGHRQYSKSHGDLSKLRPKSPPLLWVSGRTQGFHLSPQNLGEDFQDAFSQKHNRQERRAIPREWTSQQWSSEQATSPTHGGPRYPIPSLTKIQNPARISGISVPITIQGLNLDILHPLDFCAPVVRPFLADTQGCSGQSSLIQLMDVTTTWNGMQYVEARELYRIHQSFTTTLERMLADEIWKIYWRQNELPYTTYNESQKTTSVLRGISFCRNQLVEEMANSLRSSENDMLRGQLGLMRLYLAATDYLVPYDNHHRDTSITVRVYHDNESSVHNPIVEAAWVPDSLLFNDLNPSPCEGQEIFIVPRYQSKSAFGSRNHISNVRYDLESQQTLLSWLRWDDKIAGFRGIVPTRTWIGIQDRGPDGAHESHRSCRKPLPSGNKLHIDVRAVLTDNNGGLVQYERAVRARITLQILPWHILNVPYLDNKSQAIASRDSNASHGTGNVSHILPQPKNLNNSDGGGCGHSSLPSGDETRAIASLSLVQKHTNPSSKYTDLSQRSSHTETYARLPGSFLQSVNEPAAQDYGTEERDFPTGRHPSQGQRWIGDGNYFEDLCNSQQAPKSLRQPPSPQAQPARQAESVQDISNAALSASPPHARYLFPSQTFDKNIQAWSRVQTPEALMNFQSDISAMDTNGFQHDRGIRSPLENEVMRTQGEAYSGSPCGQSFQGHPIDAGIASISPGSEGLQDSSQGAYLYPSDNYGSTHTDIRSKLRQAKSILNPASALEKSRENERDTSSSCSVRSRIPFSNYYSPLQDYESTLSSLASLNPSSSYEAEVSSPGQGSAKTLRPETPSTSLPDIARGNGPDHWISTPSEPGGSSQWIFNPLTGPSSPMSKAFTPQGATIAQSVGQDKLNNSRIGSLYSCQSGGDSSRAPSSSIQVSLEDPETSLSRSIQAKRWSQIPSPEDSDKENQPEPMANEPRPSHEEKTTFENAMNRSLEEITGSFDKIFLLDSDNPDSEDDNNGN